MASAKFDKLIEYVIANDDKKARSLFHQIVVDKSRKIYEALDMDNTERAFDDVEADHTASGEQEFGGDAADDLETDVFADGEVDGGEELEGEGAELNPEIDDRVADLETEFDALKAEFEELLQAEEGGEDSSEEEVFDDGEGELEGLDSAVADEEAGTDEEEAGEESEEAGEEETEAGEHEEEAGEEEEEAGEEEKEEAVDESVIKEYVLKVTKGLANEKEEGFVNTKSVNAGKNDIVKGVDAKNLNQGGESKGRPNPTTKEMTTDKIANRPGADSGVKSLKPAPKPVTTKEESGVNTKAVES
jgi:hypothetical protein